MSTNPNTVKSQHELNEGGRKSDVLIHTLEELEKTKKQLEIAKKALRTYTIKGETVIHQDETTRTVKINYFNDHGTVAQNALDEINCIELDYMELNK
jgi:hypothetical protein